MLASSDLDLCPACGDFVSGLRDDTGWCNKCSKTLTCQRCGDTPDGTHKFCRRCRRARWLEENADEIERLQAQGLSTTQAILQIKLRVKEERRCVNCGAQIERHASRGIAYFCDKVECRVLYRRYRYHRYKKGLPPQEAINRALNRTRS